MAIRSEDRTRVRLNQLASIGLKLQPEFCYGYEDFDKCIFIKFYSVDILYMEDDLWDKEFNGAKELMLKA